MKTAIILIGAGGHAVSVTNVALSCGYSVVSYVDDKKKGAFLLGVPIISTDECCSKFPNHNYCIAIGDNAVRERVANEFKKKLPKAKFPVLVHSSSVLGIASNVSEGTVIMPQSNIGPNSSVGAFCIINTSSSIDHDCTVKDFASIAPGAITGGNVSVGTRSAVSIGATLKHGITVGDDVVIGASSYVGKNIENNVVAYGTPCKVVRSRKLGDSYLS